MTKKGKKRKLDCLLYEEMFFFFRFHFYPLSIVVWFGIKMENWVLEFEVLQEFRTQQSRIGGLVHYWVTFILGYCLFTRTN